MSTFEQNLKMALGYVGISQAELARRMDMSPQALNSKLKTGKYSQEDLEKFSKALGCEIRITFKLPNGMEL